MSAMAPLILRVDDLDNDGVIQRELQDFLGVDAGGFAEPHEATQHGRTGQVQLARLFDDHLVEWVVIVLVRFTDENAQEGVFRDLHRRMTGGQILGLSATAQIKPSHTAAMHNASEPKAFKLAASHSPSRRSRSVCKLNEEKVV